MGACTHWDFRKSALMVRTPMTSPVSKTFLRTERLLSDINNISHGSVATRLRCAESSIGHLISNFLQSVLMKEL